MNAKNNARIALTVVAAGLMVGGLAPLAMADPSAPPKAPAAPMPVVEEPCSALRQAIDTSNMLAEPRLIHIPEVVRVSETELTNEALLLGVGGLGGAAVLGSSLIGVQYRNRRNRQGYF